MSKVNRRKEIKEKEAFQLQFQLAISANNNNVLKWLPNSQDTLGSGHQSIANEKGSFLDLPVIPNGAGLSELDKEENSSSTQTIGSFLNAENVPKKQNLNTSRDARTGSKAMSALMNKMRSDTRKNLSEKYSVNKERSEYRPRSRIMEDMKKQKQKQASKPGPPDASAPDSDEEESKMKQISGKKKTVPQFGKKGKGRPF
ncbi:hypothetical protein JCM33374_g959 [Metschnikowia sp. JCM 33374]|nr:hypothetical protein JCM33374_g959 [Metschnikowia sp. JCM 33374]